MFSLRFLGTWAFVVVCLVGCGTFEAEAEHQGSPTPQPLPVGALLERRSSLPAPTPGFDGQRALDHVVQQMRWQSRSIGTTGHDAVVDYITAEAQHVGWMVEEQRFEYRGTEIRNIIARRGTGPLLILGAHYDTRLVADRDPDPTRRTDPVPGANDGASGVAVLLELARHINPDELGREVWLTFFDAEDHGKIEGWEFAVGSRYLAEHLPRPAEAMLLVDMVGDRDLHLPYEANSTPALRESIWQTAAELGYTQFVPKVKYQITDDHMPFLEKGIPAVDLVDFEYPAWHTTGDTLDKVSAESLDVVGRTLERWLDTRAPARAMSRDAP